MEFFKMVVSFFRLCDCTIVLEIIIQLIQFVKTPLNQTIQRGKLFHSVGKTIEILRIAHDFLTEYDIDGEI